MKHIRRIAEIPENIYREIKFAIQRVRRGYSSKDVSNFAGWFLETIPNMLRDLAKIEHGYPYLYVAREYYERVVDKYPVSFETLTEVPIDIVDKKTAGLIRKFDEECFDYWIGIIVQMAALLEEYRDAQAEYSDYNERDEVRNSCIKEFSELLAKYFKNLWA